MLINSLLLNFIGLSLLICFISGPDDTFFDEFIVNATPDSAFGYGDGYNRNEITIMRLRIFEHSGDWWVGDDD